MGVRTLVRTRAHTVYSIAYLVHGLLYFFGWIFWGGGEIKDAIALALAIWRQLRTMAGLWQDIEHSIVLVY